MPKMMKRDARAGAAAAAMLAVGVLLVPTVALAQSSLQDLLGGAVSGVLGQQDRQVVEDAVRACEQRAQDRDIDVRRTLEARRASDDEIEVPLEVEEGRNGYTVVCTYDSQDKRVSAFEETRSTSGRSRDETGSVSRRLADRASDACKDAAYDNRYDDVEAGDVHQGRRDQIEVSLRARDRGDRVNLTCLYDDERERAEIEPMSR